MKQKREDSIQKRTLFALKVNTTKLRILLLSLITQKKDTPKIMQMVELAPNNKISGGKLRTHKGKTSLL